MHTTMHTPGRSRITDAADLAPCLQVQSHTSRSFGSQVQKVKALCCQLHSLLFDNNGRLQLSDPAFDNAAKELWRSKTEVTESLTAVVHQFGAYCKAMEDEDTLVEQQAMELFFSTPDLLQEYCMLRPAADARE